MLKHLSALIRLAKKLILKKQNGVFYINGPETLPPPLDTEEENRCLEGLLANDSVAKNTLVEHNLRLVVYIAKKFENTGIGLEDLISIGTIGLIKAINTFNPQKNIKLATYASRCIENEILMYIRKTNNQKLEISIDEPINIDWDGNELLLSDILGSDGDSVYSDLESDEDRKIVKKAISELNDRDRLIITLRFGLETGNEKTQKEVADLLGISQSYISRLEKRIIEKLKREIGNKI
ncbi:MAG: RNA polymerase sporulation sigma factor SigE [Ruminococcaceae bacterium]|nr:RNA polymerase sporulation sigma factor SigE [Oscillospiraceae bacterium]